MTQSNPLLNNEEVLAEDTRQAGSAQTSQDKTTRRAILVGNNIGLNNLLFLILGIYLAIQTGAWQAYAIVVLAVEIMAGGFLAATLIRRGRPTLGGWVMLITDLAAPTLSSLTVVYIGYVAVAYILISSFFIINYAMPREKRRLATIITIIALTFSFVVETINPAWRMVSPLVITATPIFTGILGVIFLGFLAWQAWLRNNIRSRLLVFSLGLTLITVAALATISVNSLLSASQQAQESSSTALREEAEDDLENSAINTAKENELFLQVISQDAGDVARQAAEILENPSAFNAEGYWLAEQQMFFGPEGQYINGDSDVSSVFIPNIVEVDENIDQQLELLAYLDMVFVPVYEGNSNTVAIYFIGTNNITRLHPNINLGAIIPADQDTTAEIFFTIATPENNPDREVVWTAVYDDPAGQGLLVSAIAPVYARNRFRGVIGIDVSLADLTAAIEKEDLDTGGYSFLLDSDGRALALPEQGYRDFYGREREADEFGSDFVASARPEFASVISDMLSGTTNFQSVEVNGQELYIAYTTMESTGWHVASVVASEQVLAPATAIQTGLERLSNSLIFGRILPIGAAFIVMVVVASVFFTNRLVKPLEELTGSAEKIGAGDWDAPLPHSDLVEIDGLSRTLRDMVSQLKDTLDSLEHRVVERTQNLVLAADVGRSVSQVRDLDVMLKDACELIRKEFDLYYVQVYLTNPSQTVLQLQAGTGEVGAQLRERGHGLQINTDSINGRAVIEKRTVVISDTAESVTFRPNPLLPETRGEMAVPLLVGDKVVGVLDMQSSHPGTLTEEVLPAFEALAGQLAVAIQNANLVAETDQARAELEAQARRLVRAGWSEYLDAIHKPEHFGYVFDHNEVAPLVETEELPEESRTISAPISLTGEELGSLVVEVDEESKNEQTGALVNIVARQVAQQIENLRLLESAERYRHEAEQAARRQTLEGWQEYLNARSGESLGYLYDLSEVRPYSNGKDDASAWTLPLKVRDEAIGKLSVQGLTPDDGEAVELANAVAERLGAHIESLRQYGRTQSALAQSEKLFEASRSLTQATDLQELVAATVKTLGVSVVNRALLTTFDYGSAGDLEQLTVIANWWNETGHEVTPVGTRYPLEVIQVMPMFVSPTPVFFNDTFIDERVDATTMELVKKLNLRAVAALPLHLGTQQIGSLILEAEDPHNFTPEETRLFESLAPQIATVLENRQQYERAQRQAEREAMLNAINQKIQSATSVEAVLQIAARELGHALGAPMTIAQLSMKDQN